MTYDPHGRDRPDILRKRDDSMSGALTGGIAIALLLLFGVAIFALSSGNRDIVATDAPRTERTTPAPSTTGQGGTAGRARARSEHSKPEHRRQIRRQVEARRNNVFRRSPPSKEPPILPGRLFCYAR